MAPSISSSCAVSRRMRAICLLSMTGNYRPCSGPEKSNGGRVQPKKPLGHQRKHRTPMSCDRSVLIPQARAMKQVTEARVRTHGIVDWLHLYRIYRGGVIQTPLLLRGYICFGSLGQWP